MNLLNSLKQRFTKDEMLVLFTVLLLGFPYYLNMPFYVLVLIYLFYSKKAIVAFKNTPFSNYLLGFLLLITCTSILYRNWFGLLCCFLFFIFFTLLIYYKQVVTHNLFSTILDLILLLSLFWAFIGFIEYLDILQDNHIIDFVIKVFARRENRPNSVMYNANYYASAIEIVILIAFYKFVESKKTLKAVCWYGFIVFVNSLLLILTGCRTSWVSIVCAIFAFLLVNKNIKSLLIFGISAIIVSYYFLMNLDKIPRIDYLISNLGVRQNIWITALHGIKDHPFIGKGPMTYALIAHDYGGHITQHAHSIYLDPILSFGFVGIGLLCPYCYREAKNILSLASSHRTHFAFIFSVVVTTLVHGLTDYSVFFIHPSLLFLYVTASFSAYQNTK